MRLSSSQKASLLQAAKTYYAEVGQVKGYLAARGLDDEAVERHRLGYVADPLPGHESMAGRLAIPFLTPAGVADIRFRCVADHVCKEVGCPKYMGLPGRPTPMYNVLALHSNSPKIGVTEGELDAVAATRYVIPSVGIPGAEAWKPHYARCLADFDVIVFCDGDKAGRQLGRTIVREIPSATIVNLPDGDDVNSTIQRDGPDGLRRKAGV